MSYPVSVVSFGTKNPGDTIQPSHINDLQAEVVAVETALINGPIQLGASTMTTLSVSGASTLAGAVTIAGPLTLSSGVASTVSFASSVTMVDLSVTGTLVANVTQPSVLVTHDADQNAANNTWTGLSWNTEVSDAQGMHSTSVNSSRLTMTHSSGLYLVGANVNWNPNSNGSRLIRIMCNDSSCVAANKVEQFSAAPFGASVSGLARVASTSDYFTVMVLHNAGSTLSITNSTTYANSFWAYKASV